MKEKTWCNANASNDNGSQKSENVTCFYVSLFWAKIFTFLFFHLISLIVCQFSLLAYEQPQLLKHKIFQLIFTRFNRRNKWYILYKLIIITIIMMMMICSFDFILFKNILNRINEQKRKPAFEWQWLNSIGEYTQKWTEKGRKRYGEMIKRFQHSANCSAIRV